MPNLVPDLMQKLEPTHKYLSSRALGIGCIAYSEAEDLDQIASEAARAFAVADQYFSDYHWGMGERKADLLSKFLNDCLILIHTATDKDPLKASAIGISMHLSTLVNDWSRIHGH